MTRHDRDEHGAAEAHDVRCGDDARRAVESTADRRASDQDPSPARALRPRRRRRATTPPPPGSDPSPIGEPERHRADENDARLAAEKPPHY